MAYLVLARQYRPQNFSTLVGQEHVVMAITNAIKQQRLHHAYLFTGTRGVGKTTISRILAKSLNCLGLDGQGGITAEPCGKCLNCTAIDQGRFSDYIELDAASNRGVDEIQQLLEQAVYKPVQGRFKVFMIDEVHMMTNHAFNAMLKTLEEPPEYLKFVLATTDPQKVPVTVLSRCLQFNLRPIPIDTIVSCLVDILNKENVAQEITALQLLARSAKGSMRDALSLTDQAIAFGQGTITLDQVRQMLGAVDDKYVSQIINALANGDGRTVVEIVDGLRVQGLSATAALEEIIGLTQKIAVEQMAPATDEQQDSAQQQIISLAQQLPADETQLLYSLCLHGQTELGLAPDEYSALTMLLLRLLAFKKKATNKINATATQIKQVKIQPVEKIATTVIEPIKPESSVAQTAPEQEELPPQLPDVLVSATASETQIAQDTTTDVQTQTDEIQPVEKIATTIESIISEQIEPQPQLFDAATNVEKVSEVQIKQEAVIIPEAVNLQIQTATDTQQDSIAEVANSNKDELSLTSESLINNKSLSEPEAKLADYWIELMSSLQNHPKMNAMVKQLALHSELIQRQDDLWLLKAKSALSFNAGLQLTLQEIIASAGMVVRLQVQAAESQHQLDTLAVRQEQQKQLQSQQAQQILLQDEYVNDLVTSFAGKFAPQSLVLVENSEDKKLINYKEK